MSKVCLENRQENAGTRFANYIADFLQNDYPLVELLNVDCTPEWTTIPGYYCIRGCVWPVCNLEKHFEEYCHEFSKLMDYNERLFLGRRQRIFLHNELDHACIFNIFVSHPDDNEDRGNQLNTDPSPGRAIEFQQIFLNQHVSKVLAP